MKIDFTFIDVPEGTLSLSEKWEFMGEFGGKCPYCGAKLLDREIHCPDYGKCVKVDEGLFKHLECGKIFLV